MNISLAPEKIFDLGPFAITNSAFSAFIVLVFLLFVVFYIVSKINVYKPSKFQLVVEFIFTGLKSMIEPILGSSTKTILPLALTFFIFILASNLFGLLPISGNIGFWHSIDGEKELIPFFRAPTSDISATLTFSLISVIVANVMGFRHLGFKYLKKYFDFSSGINFFVGILELVSEIGKLISFTFRLFGNIFAGEVLLLVITNISYGVATLPFFGLEIFIVFIQAFVFYMLTSIFIGLASKSEH